MERYFAVISTGMKETIVREINGTSDSIENAITGKINQRHLYLSILSNGALDLNPSIPLFIYGAHTVSCIVKNGTVIYNFASGYPAEKEFEAWALEAVRNIESGNKQNK